MSEVKRYSDQQIAYASTRFRMEPSTWMVIEGDTVPDTEMFVRAADYDALRVDYLNATQGRDIATSERDAALAECARLRAFLTDIYGIAHEASTGSAVKDRYWEIREFCDEALTGAKP